MGRTKGKLTEQQELGQDDRVREIGSAASRRGRPPGAAHDPATISSSAESSVFGLVDEKGYRADRFYTRSTDGRGHGVKMQVRVPQGIDSQMHGAIAEIPEYRSMQDFIRDAIIHRLEWLQRSYSLDASARRFVELERHMTDLERISAEVQVMTAAVDRVKVNLEIAFEGKDWGLMKEALDQGSEAVEWMREPYRGRVDQVVKEWRTRIREDLARWEKERDEN